MGKAKQKRKSVKTALPAFRGHAPEQSLHLERQAYPRLQPFTQRFVKSDLETTYISTRGDFACMGAAAYFAVLAYPREYAKRDEFIEAVKARLFKSWRNTAADLIERKRRRKEIGSTYSGFKNEHIAGVFNRAFARILKRVRPAREVAENLGMAYAMFEIATAFSKHSSGAPAKIPTKSFPKASVPRACLTVEVKFPFGLNQSSAALEMGRRMYEQAIREQPGAPRFPGDDKNVLRTLRESRPAVHLALAMPLDKDEHGQPVFDQKIFWQRICKPTWLENSLECAELYRCIFLRMVFPKYDCRKAICLLPEGGPTPKAPSRM